MCNHYRVDVPPQHISEIFRADFYADRPISSEVERGSLGLVIKGGTLQQMHWGLPQFLNREGAPRFDLMGMNTALGADKDSWMGRDSFVHRRCLVPMTAIGEHFGRHDELAWFGVPNMDVFACAGVWRDTLQAGSVFTLIFRDCEAAERRTPVVLSPSQYTRWLFGDAAEADKICDTPLMPLQQLTTCVVEGRAPARAF